MKIFGHIFLLIFALAGLAAAQTPLRIMAANTTNGNAQAYDAAGIRMFQALDADIVLIQEFNYLSNTQAQLDQFVDTAFGTEFFWSREPGGDQIPNGVISRYPITNSGEWNDPEVSNRDFAWARIDVPGSKDLWAISVHLLTSSSSDRNAEAQAIMQNINALVPAGDYVTVGGDFNTGSRMEAALNTLSSYFVTGSPWPVDDSGNGNTNANQNDPYDWVLADFDLDPFEVPVVYGPFSYTNGLVFDPDDYTAGELTTHFSPVTQSDDDAMQHYPVIRQFSIPGAEDYTVSPTSVNFGLRDAGDGAVTSSTVEITVQDPFTITGVTFTGTHPGEFELVTPSLPAALSTDQTLTFRWTPASNDGVARSVTATFATNGDPSSFAITLTGDTEAPVPDYTVSPTNIDFGTRDALDGSATNNSVAITLNQPITLTSVTFTGTHAAEFTLVSPELPAPLTANQTLIFRWTPAGNDNVARSATATIATNGQPPSFQISLTGLAAAPGGGGDVDVSGWQVQQTGGTASTATLPLGTVIPHDGFLIIGRQATRSAFEAAWGVTLSPNVVYLNGTDLVPGNGFPIINATARQFRLVDDASAQVDPPGSGSVPNPGTTQLNTHQRDATATTTFTVSPRANATPGSWSGTENQSDRVIITEVSDAAAFENEFIELHHDAAPAAAVRLGQFYY